MHSDFTERRKHIRVYFSEVDEMRCLFVRQGESSKEVPAAVIDLSLGGIHLAVAHEHTFRPGERLILTMLSPRDDRSCPERITLEIRWVFVQPGFKRLYMGGQFLELSKTSHAFLSDIIAQKLRQRSPAHDAATEAE